jgi:AcrR family transcriptional regulator
MAPVLDAPERSRDDRRAARRDQRLDDAIEAIREIGVNVTMDQLARRGGVTKPILYRHFGDRDGLISAIAERFALALIAELDRGLSTGDYQALLEGTVDAYLAFIEAEPDLYRFLVHHTTATAPSALPMSPLVSEIARRVAGAIGGVLAENGHDPAAAVPWSFAIVGLVHQAGDWWLEDHTMPRETLTKHLCALLWGGISPRAGSPGGPAPTLGA